MTLDIFDMLDEAQHPSVRRREWMDECTFTRVAPDNLTACIDHCINAPGGRFSLDLETSGLDNRVFFDANGVGRTKDYIVGICLSPDEHTGYYVPLQHQNASINVPWSVFRPEFKRLMAAVTEGKVTAVFHGGIFDQEFLEFNGDEPLGDWDSPKVWDDSEIEVYLENPRRKNKQLKFLSRTELGIDQIELKELYPEDHEGPMDFGVLDPEQEGPLWYGGGDGICTLRLSNKFKPKVVENDEHGRNQKSIYQIEKMCVPATRWMHRNRICIDVEKVKELIRLGQQEWFDAIMAVYESAKEILGRDVMPGYYKVLADKFVADDVDDLIPAQLARSKGNSKLLYPDPQQPVEKDGKQWQPIYDVNAPAQLGQMFLEMRVPGLQTTEKTGQVVTKKEVLDQIIEVAAARFPFMGKVKRFREVHKALSGYLYPMLLDHDPADNTIRINFRAHKVDTGRFATPSKDRDRAEAQGKRMIGWPQVNLQSVPATYDPDRPECMRRIRECIVARPGYFMVAIDFAGVELRLVTNLSREPLWLAEFFRCSSCGRAFDRGDGQSTPPPPPPRCPNCGSDKIGDLHTLTGISIYGQDAPSKPEWKQIRQNSKSTNFALCYGGGGGAVVRACKGQVKKNEGWRIKRVFDETYKGLHKWWDFQHAFARKHKYVLTGLGRKYPVPDIDHADGGFRSKAERNSVNGPIQGTSADITKLAMALIYKECKKRGWLDKCRMIITMHDELVFEIQPDILEEAIEVLKDIMCSNPVVMAKKWPVPLTSDVEIGRNWAVQWDLNGMRAGEVRYHGNKKFKKPEDAAAAGLDWNSLPTFPEALRPYFKYQTFKAMVRSDPSWEEAPAAPAPAAVALDPPPSGSAPAPAPVLPEPPPDHPGFVVAQRLPSQAVDGVLSFRVPGPLTTAKADALARAVRWSRGKGTVELRIVMPDGSLLNEQEVWKSYFGNGPILVGEHDFYFTARAHGLQG